MTTTAGFYSTIDVEYNFPNEETSSNVEFAQFNSVVGNMIFTPDNDTEPEDLQFRTSKEVKFFLGSNDVNSNNSNFSIAFMDDDERNELKIRTTRYELDFRNDIIGFSGIKFIDNSNYFRLSSQKMFQVHSGERFEFLNDAEFKDSANFDKNIYIGESLIFQESNFGADSEDQVRIAMQYNQNRDCIDFVKQQGDGSTASLKLLARLGDGSIMGGSARGQELSNIPFYQTYSQDFSRSAPVYEDIFDTFMETNAGRIELSSFSNDAGYLSTMQEIPIERKWRFKEADDGSALRIEKYDDTAQEWVMKFQFQP